MKFKDKVYRETPTPLLIQVKIFVSYRRRDAGDFAQQIYEHLKDEHDVFIDIDIQVGDIWSNIIENNISSCDVFVVIVTHGALKSEHVEKEVKQAQKESKIIIPCIHRDVNQREASYGTIKWGLGNIQGIEFKNEFDLARSLYSRIEKLRKTRHKDKADKVDISILNPITEIKDKLPPSEQHKETASPTYYASPLRSSSPLLSDQSLTDTKDRFSSPSTSKEVDWISVDTRPLFGSKGHQLVSLYEEYETVGDFLSSIYSTFPFNELTGSYTKSWAIKDENKDNIILYVYSKPDRLRDDGRKLPDINIYPGMRLSIVSP